MFSGNSPATEETIKLASQDWPQVSQANVPLFSSTNVVSGTNTSSSSSESIWSNSSTLGFTILDYSAEAKIKRAE